MFARVLNTPLQSINHNFNPLQPSLREKCPIMELFLVRIFLYSVRIWTLHAVPVLLKPTGFLMFSGGTDKQHRAVMGLVEDLAKTLGSGGETIHILT